MYVSQTHTEYNCVIRRRQQTFLEVFSWHASVVVQERSVSQGVVGLKLLVEGLDIDIIVIILLFGALVHTDT